MKNIFLLAKNILKGAFRKKTNIITFIFLPILGVIMALVLNNSGTSYTKVGIVDLNNTYLSKDMVSYIKENKNFIVKEAKKEDIEKSLLNKEADCIVVINKDFHKDIYSGKLEKINIYSIRGQEVTAWIENCVNYYCDNLVTIGKASENNEEIFKKIYNGYKEKELKLKNVKLEDQGKSKSATKQSIGLLLVFMLMASSVTYNFIMKDKFNRTYFRVFCSSVTKTQYIIANIVANFIIFLIQIALIMILSLKVLKLNFYISTPIMVLILCTFGVACIAFGIIIAAFSKSMSQASQLANILIIPTCMLSGCYWPIEMMPQWIQRYANIFPQTWIMKTVDALQYGKSFKEVYINLIFVIIFALVLFQVGIIKMYRDENLKNII